MWPGLGFLFYTWSGLGMQILWWVWCLITPFDISISFFHIPSRDMFSFLLPINLLYLGYRTHPHVFRVVFLHIYHPFDMQSLGSVHCLFISSHIPSTLLAPCSLSCDFQNLFPPTKHQYIGVEGFRYLRKPRGFRGCQGETRKKFKSTSYDPMLQL